MLRKLEPRTIDVWPVFLNAQQPVVLRFAELLSPDEMIRAQRFRFEHLKTDYTLSTGALRILVGKYTGTDPSQVRFAAGVHGKPRIESSPNFHFNGSHSGGLALFAFTGEGEIGIDVERLRPMPDMEDLAALFFSPEEAADLQSVEPSQRERAFFLCWTRKEAYLKATGEGLFAALDGFRVSLRPDEPSRFIWFRDGQPPDNWCLYNLDVVPGYVAAAAYRGAPCFIRLFSSVRPFELL